jgi:hypothetical protein
MESSWENSKKIGKDQRFPEFCMKFINFTSICFTFFRVLYSLSFIFPLISFSILFQSYFNSFVPISISSHLSIIPLVPFPLSFHSLFNPLVPFPLSPTRISTIFFFTSFYFYLMFLSTPSPPSSSLRAVFESSPLIQVSRRVSPRTFFLLFPFRVCSCVNFSLKIESSIIVQSKQGVINRKDHREKLR